MSSPFWKRPVSNLLTGTVSGGQVKGTMFELINTAILNLDRADPLYEATSLTSKRQ